MMQKLTPIPHIEKLSERVIRVLGCNPGPYTLQGTNTYLIGTGKRRILLDTGNNNVKEYTKMLSKALRDFNCGLQEIIITHYHPDHIGGVPDVCSEVCKETIKVSKHSRLKPFQEEKFNGIEFSFLQDKDIIRTDGATLKALYTPGHADDHIVLYMEEENAMFSGDNILGESTAVFEDLHTYMQSLNIMLEEKPEIIYPAHGPVVSNPQDYIKYYIKHRQEREAQILQALQSQHVQTCEEIVERVYTDLQENLKPAACKNVNQHLEKLRKENKIDSIKENGKTKWKFIMTSNI